MPITGLPTFTAKTKLLAAQLNQAMTAITSKFNGAITGSDMAWPLTAQGNLNMNGNQVLRVSRFRNVYNMAEYTANIQGLFDTIAAAGGGTIYVPANTTIDISGITCNVNGSLHIYGEGATSVLRMAIGSVTDMLRLTVSGSLTIRDIKFDGNATGSATKALLRLSTCVNTRLSGVEFTNSAGYGLLTDYISAAGTGCSNVYLQQCRFNLMIVADAVRIEDTVQLWFTNCSWKANTKILVNIAPQSAAAYGKNIHFRGCSFESAACTTQSFMFRDSSAATAVPTQYAVSFADCVFEITHTTNVAMFEGWYCDYFSMRDCYVTFQGSNKPCIYLRKSQHIGINSNTFLATGGDVICIGHIGSNDTTTTSDGIRMLSVNDNLAVVAGGRFLVAGYPKTFSIMNNSVNTGNNAAFAGTVCMIALWSVPNGAANALQFHGRICYNSYSSGYADVAEITQTGHGGASSNVGGGGFDSRLVVIGNINQGVAVSAAQGLTNNGDINDTVLADAHINEHNIGA